MEKCGNDWQLKGANFQFTPRSVISLTNSELASYASRAKPHVAIMVESIQNTIGDQVR